MPDIFTFFARYFWLVALIVCAMNAGAYRRRFGQLIADHPERARGYQRFLIGFLVIQALVWSIMGVGIVVGDVPSVFAYFYPASGNPYVLAWHGALIMLWLLGLGWMFVGGGAQFVVDHPGLLNVPLSNPRLVQLWFGACLLGGVLGEVMMWTQGSAIPLP